MRSANTYSATWNTIVKGGNGIPCIHTLTNTGKALITTTSIIIITQRKGLADPVVLPFHHQWQDYHQEVMSVQLHRHSVLLAPTSLSNVVLAQELKPKLLNYQRHKDRQSLCQCFGR